jgi:hypothetical protein
MRVEEEVYAPVNAVSRYRKQWFQLVPFLRRHEGIRFSDRHIVLEIHQVSAHIVSYLRSPRAKLHGEAERILQKKWRLTVRSATISSRVRSIVYLCEGNST